MTVRVQEFFVSAPATSPVANILAFDVEDWYHLSGEQIRGHGTLRPDLLARQLDRLLDLLDRHATRATFFCLGSSLVDAPHLVHRIAAAGHEIGTHGWAHRLIRHVGLPAFRTDLLRSLAWLQDLLGRPVIGHRAPAFSVAPEQIEGFYDICFEAGVRYDSSLFPMRGRRRGIPDAPLDAHVVRQDGDRRLVEVPLTALVWRGRGWPVAGGGYWRLLPAVLIKAAVARVSRAGRPFVTYMHPYEFDTQRLSAMAAAGWSFRSLKHLLKQNLRRGTMHAKLDAVLRAHPFDTIEHHLRAAGLI